MHERILNATDEQVVAAHRALGELRLRHTPITPTPKQEAFLRVDRLEAFYGGAVGGGKSAALLAGALQYVDVPGYAALLLRRTYQDLSLPGALMDRAAEWLANTPARWSEIDHRWSFPSGASVTFGYLQHENDKNRYAGTSFQYVGLDELTQFTESQFRSLFRLLRRSLEPRNAAPDGYTLDRVPLRLRAASNPGGAGHAWVAARYVDAETRESGAVFVPARLDENPHLDQAAYLESLSHLTSVERRRLVEGDWQVPDEGTVFRPHEWIELLDPATIAPRGTRSCRRWDLAATPVSQAAPDPDHAVGLLLERWPDGSFLIRDIARARTTPAGLENLARQTADLDGPTVTVVVEQEPGASGKALVETWARSVLAGYEVRGQRPIGSKEERARPLAAAAERGLVRCVRAAWTRDLLDELAAFPNGSHDDQVDALSGAYQYLARPSPGVRVSVATGRIPGSAPSARRR